MTDTALDLTTLILCKARIYRRGDLEKVKQEFSAKRAQAFIRHTQSEPNERGAPIMLVWPQGAIRFGREADLRNEQSLTLAWICAASGKTGLLARARALCLPPYRGRGYSNVASLPPAKGEE